jgi:hypothetical protein
VRGPRPGITFPFPYRHAAGHAAGFALFFRDAGDHGFGGEHETRDRGRVLQGSAGDLRRVDDAGGDEGSFDCGFGIADCGI